MADEAARLETKTQEKSQRDTVAARVAQLVAMADAARSSGNALDLAAVQQTLGGEAMLDAAVGMMEANVRSDLDNVTVQTALTAALSQQKLIEDAKTQGIITDAQASQLSGLAVAEVKASIPAKSEEPKVEAPAETTAVPVNQVAAKRDELKAAMKPDEIAAKREEQAGKARGVA